MNDHHLICGYGSTGQAAARALVGQDVDPRDIVVVDNEPDALEAAVDAGFAAIDGNASKVAVLKQAAIDRATSVIVTPNRDDTAVLITLTARELNPGARIVATCREQENMHLLRQSGADAAIDSSAAVGRLVGIATKAPGALDLIDDLLDRGTDLDIVEVAPLVQSDGSLEAPSDCRVLEVVRGTDRLAFDNPEAHPLQPGDRLMAVKSV